MAIDCELFYKRNVYSDEEDLNCYNEDSENRYFK